jgi:hypothetical protein
MKSKKLYPLALIYPLGPQELLLKRHGISFELNHEARDMVVIQFPPIGPEHNALAAEITSCLQERLPQNFTALYDTFSYIEADKLEAMGHFKNGAPHEYMQTRLLELGASPSFIAEAMAQLLKQGIMPSSYAPDVCVINDADFDNRFRVPVWIGEIVSKDTRDYDLYFKAYLYERLGVNEYFVFETGKRSGKLLRAYRLDEKEKPAQYRELALAGAALRMESCNVELPYEWSV